MSVDPGATWALDEWDRVMGPDTLATWNARTRQPGGEWDAIRHLPRRVRRSLTSAGFMSAGGLLPDVAADRVRLHVEGITGTDEAIAWIIRTAREAIRQRRRVNHRHRHERFARAQGAPSYYAWRDARAIEQGYGSLWAMRRDRWAA